MADFAKLNEVKEFLQITSTNDDSLITNMISRTTKMIQDYLGRNIFSRTITELQSGDGMTSLITLREYPIISVTTIHDDPNRTFGSGTLLIKDTTTVEGDYIIIDEDDPDGENAGEILCVDGVVFSKGDKNIKVVYIAGYATASIPKTLVMAQIDLVAFFFRNKDMRLGIDSYRLGQFSVKYTPNDTANNKFAGVPAQILSSLDMYKDIRMFSTEGQTGINRGGQ